MNNTPLSLLWFGYRRLRSTWFSLLGRNPLARGEAALSMSQEWESIRGLNAARGVPPRKTAERDGLVCWMTASGPMWTPPGAGVKFVGQLAAEMRANVYDLRFLKQMQRPTVVLDCGANVGFFTRYALDKGVSRVVAFEPSPGNARCLRANLRPEDLSAGRVTVIEKGVWDCATTLSFSTTNTSNPGGHSISADGGGDTSIEVTSIDQAVRELNLPHVDYIKMDVEGAEVRALQGAAEVIRRFRPTLCVATEHTSDLFANTMAVIEQMQKLDSSYRFVATEAHPYQSPSRGLIMTPYSLLFSPVGKPAQAASAGVGG